MKDYSHALAAYWRAMYPLEEKASFRRELLCAVAFIMGQIDPSGKRPIIYPAMHADGYQPQRIAGQNEVMFDDE